MHTAVRILRRWGLPAATLGALLLVPACQRRPEIPAGAAASIAGEYIPGRFFEATVRDQVDREHPPRDPDVQSRLFDQFIDGRLLVRLAVDRGMEPGASAAAENDAAAGRSVADLPGAAEREAIRFLLRASAERSGAPDEVAAYYAAHRDEYQRPEEIHLRQILVQERAQAEAAKAALDRGDDFVQVAARFSQGPKAGEGGDQGRLAAGDLPPDFRDLIFALKAGEISDIVEAYYGFLIFQAVEHFDAYQAPLEEVEEEIRQTLRRRHDDDLVRAFVFEARARYNVAVFPENLPFPYQGVYAKPAN